MKTDPIATEPLDLATLQSQAASGATAELLFFWGHTRAGDHRVGKECLSQWYPAPFVVDDDAYATAEHYMMVQKALLFGDTHAAERIRACAQPAEAKELGRHVRGFDDERWEQRRVEVVTTGSYAKFSQNPALRAYLLSTRPRVLVEASPKDTIWGIGLAENDRRARDPRSWRGSNLLGFALMRARQRIAAAESALEE